MRIVKMCVCAHEKWKGARYIYKGAQARDRSSKTRLHVETLS